MKLLIPVLCLAALSMGKPAASQDVYLGPVTMRLRVSSAAPQQQAEFKLIGASLSFNSHPDQLVLGDTLTFYGDHEIEIKAVTKEFDLVVEKGRPSVRVELLPSDGSEPQVFVGRSLHFVRAKGD